ncbi:MAG: universal stress protein [Microvirga sp.]|nr:universal stress protein [Microvirga sp.]
MAIKDLLVAYQGDEGSRNALRFALQMGAKYGAFVTGAHVQAPSQFAMQQARWVPEEVLEIVRRADREAVAAVESSFREAVAEIAPGAPHEWFAREGSPSLMLARMSRYFDILITGQFKGAISHGGRALQPEELIRRSGKPMLIVPENYAVREFKEEAVVAWDGSSSAARALSDAMQILETKKTLYLVTVEGGSDERIPPLEDHDIVAHLRRHSINAERVHLQRTGSVGKTIMDYCAKTDPDVLVMGAFGRAKLGALLFGGVSQYILENQCVPVLMSH